MKRMLLALIGAVMCLSAYATDPGGLNPQPPPGQVLVCSSSGATATSVQQCVDEAIADILNGKSGLNQTVTYAPTTMSSAPATPMALWPYLGSMTETAVQACQNIAAQTWSPQIYYTISTASIVPEVYPYDIYQHTGWWATQYCIATPIAGTNPYNPGGLVPPYYFSGLTYQPGCLDFSTAHDTPTGYVCNYSPPIATCDAGDGSPAGSPSMCSHKCKITSADISSVTWSASGPGYPINGSGTYTQETVHSCSPGPTSFTLPIAVPSFTPQCPSGTSPGINGGNFACSCPINETWFNGACSVSDLITAAYPLQYQVPASETGLDSGDTVSLLAGYTPNSYTIKISGQVTPGVTVPGTYVAMNPSYPTITDLGTGASVPAKWTATQTTTNGITVNSWQVTIPKTTMLKSHTYGFNINGTATVYGTTVSTIDKATYTFAVTTQ